MDNLQSVLTEEESGPPDYVFDLIQISIMAEAGDLDSLSVAVELSRCHGADNREILRAMFRSDVAFGTGVENREFLRIAESLQAGRSPDADYLTKVS